MKLKREYKTVEEPRNIAYLRAMTYVLKMIDEPEKVKRIILAREAEKYLREML